LIDNKLKGNGQVLFKIVQFLNKIFFSVLQKRRSLLGITSRKIRRLAGNFYPINFTTTLGVKEIGRRLVEGLLYEGSHPSSCERNIFPLLAGD
jgi:hypothetical protein